MVITTPTPTHTPLAVEAAEHGKHVFLEKPMAISLEECDVIIGAAEQMAEHIKANRQTLHQVRRAAMQAVQPDAVTIGDAGDALEAEGRR